MTSPSAPLIWSSRRVFRPNARLWPVATISIGPKVHISGLLQRTFQSSSLYMVNLVEGSAGVSWVHTATRLALPVDLKAHARLYGLGQASVQSSDIAVIWRRDPGGPGQQVGASTGESILSN